MQNILIEEKEGEIKLKISGFNTAREINSHPPFTDYVTTRFIRSPEQLLRISNYDSKIDIFALGCIMVELYHMAPLFCGSTELE